MDVQRVIEFILGQQAKTEVQFAMTEAQFAETKGQIATISGMVGQMGAVQWRANEMFGKPDGGADAHGPSHTGADGLPGAHGPNRPRTRC
jgi:hypothetical protein